jgi:hypothetical protein
MSRPVVGLSLGKEAQRVESCADGFDDALDDDLAEGMLWHSTSPGSPAIKTPLQNGTGGTSATANESVEKVVLKEPY